MPLAIERKRSSVLHDILVHVAKPLIKLVHPMTKLIKRLLINAAQLALAAGSSQTRVIYSVHVWPIILGYRFLKMPIPNVPILL
jgi:hypothetical protein